jgi:hypothetical protein
LPKPQAAELDAAVKFYDLFIAMASCVQVAANSANNGMRCVVGLLGNRFIFWCSVKAP